MEREELTQSLRLSRDVNLNETVRKAVVEDKCRLVDVIVIKNGDLLDMIEIASKTLFSSRTKAMTEMSYVSPPPTTKYLLEAKSFRRAVVQEVTMQASCG